MVSGCNSRTCQGEEDLKIEKVHKSDVKRLVEEVNGAEFDQVAWEENGPQLGGMV